MNKLITIGGGKFVKLTQETLDTLSYEPRCQHSARSVFLKLDGIARSEAYVWQPFLITVINEKTFKVNKCLSFSKSF